MRILTNPGSNLDEDTAIRLDVDLLPQKIVVDGISHDTRGTIDFGQIDGWVKRAIKHPQVQGTTEQDFIDAFTRLVKKDPEILCVMTSRKLIGSHDAALAAVAKLEQSPDPQLKAARIEIVDSMATDVGAGLCTLAAVQARKAGLSLQACASFARAFAERGRNVVTVATLENLIKGGRASFLQGWVGNFLNIRPVISIIDGAINSVSKMSGKADIVPKIEEYLELARRPEDPCLARRRARQRARQGEGRRRSPARGLPVRVRAGAAALAQHLPAHRPRGRRRVRDAARRPLLPPHAAMMTSGGAGQFASNSAPELSPPVGPLTR